MHENNSISFGMSDPTYVEPKLPRKQWRILCKKVCRKRKRQAAAQLREKVIQKQLEDFKVSNPSWKKELMQKKELSESIALEEQKERELLHLAWLERERVAQIEWQKKLKKEMREKEIREESERRIREEWKTMKEAEEKTKVQQEQLDSERQKKQSLLLVEAMVSFERDTVQNPPVPESIEERSIQTRPGAESCSFFQKTGCCRFGNRCSRNHIHVLLSCTLLFENFYQPHGMSYTHYDEQCLDVNLELEDEEQIRLFAEFYRDVLDELRRCGQVEKLVVCQNRERHLRGNLFVQYGSENEAARAFSVFNGRWYAGRQINARFVDIACWRAAICGEFLRNRCSKGSVCNFLHTFPNPDGEFSADNSEHRGTSRRQGNVLSGDSASLSRTGNTPASTNHESYRVSNGRRQTSESRNRSSGSHHKRETRERNSDDNNKTPSHSLRERYKDRDDFRGSSSRSYSRESRRDRCRSRSINSSAMTETYKEKRSSRRENGRCRSISGSQSGSSSEDSRTFVKRHKRHKSSKRSEKYGAGNSDDSRASRRCSGDLDSRYSSSENCRRNSSSKKKHKHKKKHRRSRSRSKKR